MLHLILGFLFNFILNTYSFLIMLPTTTRTVENYEGRLASYTDWAMGSEAAEAKRARELFLNSLESDMTLRILDVGCGPGRDVLEFARLGHYVAGIEPSSGFCSQANSLLSEHYENTSFKVVEGDICDSSVVNIELQNSFDGVFCLSSLFHIPGSKLDIAFTNIKQLIKPRGILFTSFPLSRHSTAHHHSGITTIHEGSVMPDGRWCTSLSVEEHKSLLLSQGFQPVQETVLDIYNGQWTAMVSRSIGN